MEFLLILIIALVVSMLFFNVFSRARILKSMKQLTKHNVSFPWTYIFNDQKRKKEVHSRYPDYVQEIETFSRLVRQSARIMFSLFLVTLVLGLLIQKVL